MGNAYDIFISYRRYDSGGNVSGRDIARTIKLEFRLRGYKVFFDYSDIKDENFVRTIDKAIQKSKILLLVITKDTFVRCSCEDDFLRRELQVAIDSNVKIVMASIDGAFNNWPSDFPKELHSLKHIEISSIHTDSTFEKCIDLLEENRIKNVINPSNLVKVGFRSDKLCRICDYDEEIAVLQKNQFKFVFLKKGPHHLYFEDIDNPGIIVKKLYTIEDAVMGDILQISFKSNGSVNIRPITIDSQEVQTQQKDVTDKEKQMPDLDSNLVETKSDPPMTDINSNIEDVDFVEIVDEEITRDNMPDVDDAINLREVEQFLKELINEQDVLKDVNQNIEQERVVVPQNGKADEDNLFQSILALING